MSVYIIERLERQLKNNWAIGRKKSPLIKYHIGSHHDQQCSEDFLNH
jgi:hypothetical protein